MSESIQARAVGNAIYLETTGCCGDIAIWGEASPERAEFVAAQISRAIAMAVEAALEERDDQEWSRWKE